MEGRHQARCDGVLRVGNLIAERPSRKNLGRWQVQKLLNSEYTTLDSVDLSFAEGSLARGMQSPTTKYLEERATGQSDHV